MREMNLAGVDLNLLPALEALLRRRNVTRAAEDVGLSQPAMSRALARLRAVIGDPLLVRVPGGLAPTPRALALAPGLTAALDGLGGVFREPAFAPEEMRRVFRLAATDSMTVLLTPALLPAIRAEAPGVDLRFETYGPDMRARIEDGSLDLVFAVATTPLPPGAVSEPIARDALALVMRRGHPAAGRRWTVADYAEFAHVTVAIRADDDSEIDTRLAEAGVARRIVLTTPYFLAALAAVGASDCVTTLSAAVSRRFADDFGLILANPPFSDVALTMTLVGAAARASDPGLVWLRKRIREAAATVYV
jgi:DNA-binding transcriptional LysR family regulator